MIGENWQSILALICVSAAAFALIRRAYRLLGGPVSGSCGSQACRACDNAQPAANGSDADGFVSADVLTSPRNSTADI